MLRVGDRAPNGRLVTDRPVVADRQWRRFYATLPEAVRAECSLRQLVDAVSFPFRLARRVAREPGGLVPVLRVRGFGEFAPCPYRLRRVAQQLDRLAERSDVWIEPGRGDRMRALSGKALRSSEAAARRREDRSRWIRAQREARARKRDGHGEGDGA